MKAREENREETQDGEEGMGTINAGRRRNRGRGERMRKER